MNAQETIAKARLAQANWHRASKRGDAKAMRENSATVLEYVQSLSAMGYSDADIWQAIESE